MVGRWGMSTTIGPIAVLPQDQNGPLLPGAQQTSETTQRIVDEEVRRIVDEAYEGVRRMLTEHRHQLESLTEALLRDETLDQDPAYDAAQGPRRPADTKGEPSLAALEGGAADS
jgi:cell division protease FtsH